MKSHFVFRLICVLVMVGVAAAILPHQGDAGQMPQANAGSVGGVGAQIDTTVYLPLVSNGYFPKTAGVFLPLTDMGAWPGQTATFNTLTGKTHGVYLVSSGFGCPWVDTVGKIRVQLDYIHSIGGIALITWLPMDCGNGGFGDIAHLGLPDIWNGTSGAWDDYMRIWAQDIKALGYPVLLRWGHEMNIPSYSWAGQHAFGLNGKTDYDKVADGCGLKGCFGDPNVYDGPERYILAYRHVHDVVAPIATNIVWLWNPNGRDWPLASAQSWNDYNSYYPGDAYVDWVGADGYNWGARSGNGYGVWASFDDLFHDVLGDMAARYPTKWQIIPEFGSVEDEGDPNRKAGWMTDAFNSASYNYPLLKAVCYVHDGTFIDSMHRPPQLARFQVDSSAQSLQAYKNAIAHWNSNLALP